MYANVGEMIFWKVSVYIYQVEAQEKTPLVVVATFIFYLNLSFSKPPAQRAVQWRLGDHVSNGNMQFDAEPRNIVIPPICSWTVKKERGFISTLQKIYVTGVFVQFL